MLCDSFVRRVLEIVTMIQPNPRVVSQEPPDATLTASVYKDRRCQVTGASLAAASAASERTLRSLQPSSRATSESGRPST